MRKSTRILILAVVLEVLLLALGAWLLSQIASGGLRTSTSAAEATSTITSVLGTVMGVLAGVLGVVWFVLRRRGQ